MFLDRHEPVVNKNQKIEIILKFAVDYDINVFRLIVCTINRTGDRIAR